MTDSSLSTLLQHTYVRADLVYRVSLLEEFLDFVFFTDATSSVTEDAIGHFAKRSREPSEDIKFLQTLPHSFWEAFTRDSFHGELDRISEALVQLPVLPLTLPAALPAKHIRAIGQWARAVVGQDAILDVSVDPTIAAGCQFVWKDRLHDFSLAHYLALRQAQLHTQLSAAAAPRQA